MSEENRRPLVMIADDDMEIRRILMRSFTSLDIELMEARDGEEALEFIIQHQQTWSLSRHDAYAFWLGAVQIYPQ